MGKVANNEQQSRRWMLKATVGAVSATLASIALSRRAEAAKPSTCVPTQCTPGTCTPVTCLPIQGCLPPGA